MKSAEESLIIWRIRESVIEESIRFYDWTNRSNRDKISGNNRNGRHERTRWTRLTRDHWTKIILFLCFIDASTHRISMILGGRKKWLEMKEESRGNKESIGSTRVNSEATSTSSSCPLEDPGHVVERWGHFSRLFSEQQTEWRRKCGEQRGRDDNKNKIKKKATTTKDDKPKFLFFTSRKKLVLIKVKTK